MTVLLLCALLFQESKEIDELVKDKVEADDPGVAVLAIKGGKVIHKKGYGSATLDPRAPIDTATVFELASCTKQFTALGILILRDKGKLKLDDDVRTWLKELKEHNPKRPIRVKDLIHHTSGLPDYLAFGGDKFVESNEEALNLIAMKKLEFPTGTQWSYSNTNYCLLALIIERITKKSYGAFMKEEIFDPLKMKSAAVLEKGVVLKKAALGYATEGQKFERIKVPYLTTGDGGVYLSLEDWVAFASGLPGLLKKGTLEEARTPGRFDNGKAHDYAFGMGVQKEGGKTVHFHEGKWAGFQSIYLRCVEDDWTVIVMSNRSDLNLSGMAQGIVGKLLE